MKVLRGADEGGRGREKEGLRMMTDEDLRERRRVEEVGLRSEVQGRLSGCVRRLCGGAGGVQVRVCGWLRR